MIKKISAFVLALVLCLSVIVVPASAANVELDSAKMAFSLEWDKTSYSKGDTAYLSVYMNAAEDLPLATGSFLIGLNSSVFTQADNPIADVKANATTSDLFASYWKTAETNLSWLAASVVTRVQAQNTADENALFDQYLKFTAAKNAAGTHENAGNNKDGFYGSEFDTNEPIMVIALKVSADVADGTAVYAAMTSGSITCSPAQTAWKYYSNPGNATTAANLAAADFNVVNTLTAATVGVPESIVKYSKAQIRFAGIGQTGTAADYKGTFDVRTVAKISQADFLATFTDEATAKEKITDIGFVYATTSNVADFDVEAAKAAAQNGTTGNYVKAPVTHIQHTGDGADYTFTCLITGMGEADKTDGVSCLGYVCFDGTWYYFDAAATASFGTLYDTYFPKA